MMQPLVKIVIRNRVYPKVLEIQIGDIAEAKNVIRKYIAKHGLKRSEFIRADFVVHGKRIGQLNYEGNYTEGR